MRDRNEIFQAWTSITRGPAPLEVGCAVICRSGKILITRRRENDHLGGLWEFPGGKRLEGENFEDCLRRELQEELGVTIQPGRFLRQVDYEYPEKKVSLHFYQCELVEGGPKPLHCSELKWVYPSQMKDYEFPPADKALLNELSLLNL